MFKKLLSNLPFNPSLIGEVAFYAKRIRREESIRRTGLVFVILAMAVQIFAAISPPEPTLAASDNDIIRGGFSSREQAVNYCRLNTQGFANILNYFGVSCEALASAAEQNIRSTDYDKQLHSMGRNPQGATIARTGKPTGEYQVTINGTAYYMRNLWAWDSWSHSNYKVLAAKNTSGQTIMVLFNCGNILTIGKYAPPKPPAPKPPAAKPPAKPADVCPSIPGDQYTTEECDVCPNVPGVQWNRNQCYPCPEAQKDDSVTACLEMSKTASNETQNITDADGTLAKANDVIVYTISTKNKGTQTVKDFIIEENLADVLEYATIVNLHGGKMGDNKVVTWPRQDIRAGATLSKKVTVKIKNPVPQTPISASDPGSFDLVMTNVYFGNSINIKLPPTIVKTTELGVQTLPNTGPGTTLAIAFAVSAFASYFFARSRLLAKELDIVKSDFTTTGGM